MPELQELIQLVHKCRANCPWCREQTFESYSEELFSEAKELEAAIKKKDIPNMKEELGDLLWDVIMLMHIAEHKGLFTSDEVVREVNAKMKRRKPYIVSGQEVTITEAMRIWKEEKEKEKRFR